MSTTSNANAQCPMPGKMKTKADGNVMQCQCPVPWGLSEWNPEGKKGLIIALSPEGPVGQIGASSYSAGLGRIPGHPRCPLRTRAP